MVILWVREEGEVDVVDLRGWMFGRDQAHQEEAMVPVAIQSVFAGRRCNIPDLIALEVDEGEFIHQIELLFQVLFQR